MKTAATFFMGLRHDSRSRMALSGTKYTLSEMVSVMIYDKLAWLQWAKTTDGTKGINRPQSLAVKLQIFEEEKKENDIESFNSTEDFEARRMKLLEGK